MKRSKSNRKGTSMRKLEEVLRLCGAGLSIRQIGLSCGLSPSTVSKILKNANELGLKYPVEMSELAKYRELLIKCNNNKDGNCFNGNGVEEKEKEKEELCFEEIWKEKMRKGVTLKLLWEEYRESGKMPYSCSHFCALYKEWKENCQDIRLRFEYKGGEKCFVDWAGQRIKYFDMESNCEKEAYLFVGVLGASNYMYAGVYKDMQIYSWIKGHEDMLKYFGGVPEIIVPDNTKTAVVRSNYYDPDLNPSYRELSEHYGFIILPARSGKPRDKGKVEKAVQEGERRILAALRNMQFKSFEELSRCVSEKLEELNNRAFSKMSGSRASVFEEVEKGNLKSLPCCGFDFGKWQKAKVHNDYHIQVENHYYSVPYRYIGKTVDVRISGDTVEIYFEGERISLHKRSYQKGKATTERSHRPPKHNGYLERTVELMKERGYQIGGYCGRVIEKILSEMPHPEMGFRSCEGIFRLGKLYGKERTEKACCKAYSIGISNYRTIRNILENGMEEEDDALTIVRSGMHGNIRGKKYYAQAGGIR